MTKDFSLVIPAYNEGDRLEVFLKELVLQMKGSHLSGEIIVVDDGSLEKDRNAYQRMIQDINSSDVRLVSLDKNSGKGYAIRHGFHLADARWVGFADADGAICAEEVFRLLSFALHSSGFSGVFGARILMLGYQIQRSLLRHLFGRVFVTCVTCILGIPVYDPQCGCKFFLKKDIVDFLPFCQEKGYLLDLELIAFGLGKKLKFLEIPINWNDVKGSKVRLFSDGIGMLKDLWRIKKRADRLKTIQ
ncbi:MAG: glycosyltransferase [Candidatus Omnitrophica bacterium]|nr:glycosyltransferase [Candidatus Omnitrophota bacterium]